MFLKVFGGAAPVVLGVAWLGGGFDAGYSRDVGKPQARVMAALDDLDIREVPGAPGTDAARSGGVKPLFKLERDEDSMTWLVMSGDKVATRMTAHFTPLADGAQTRVTASVDRGDAPDDFVSPAFRSERATLGLFVMALEGELNDLAGSERTASAEECQAIMDRFANGNAATYMGAESELRSMIGATAQTAMRMHATEAELRRNGCSNRPQIGYDGPSDRMRAAEPTKRYNGKSMTDAERDRIRYETP